MIVVYIVGGLYALILIAYQLDMWFNYSGKAHTEKQNVINNAPIQNQTNIAKTQYITNNTTNNIKQYTMSEDEKELLKEAYIKRGKYSQWSALEPLINTTATDYLSDNIKNKAKTTESVYVNKPSIIIDKAPASSIIKPNDVKISDVIRRKVVDKKDEVLKYKDMGARYIVRKVFNINGGSTRLAYIAAVEKLLKEG